jgi:hypothetical protein
MITYVDQKLEDAVQGTSDDVDAMVFEAAESRAHVSVQHNTKLINASASRSLYTLGDWLGSHRVPAKHAKTEVITVRSSSGNGLTLAPELNAKHFADPLIQQGEEAAALLATLDAFSTPQTVDAALKKLPARLRSTEAVEYLAQGKFLQPA